MRTLINDGWFFAKLPCGSTKEDADTAVFQPVDLPHDWLIWNGNDLYESADAWYRRDIALPEGHDPVVMIRFDGVYMDCDVLLNGEVLHTHPYGYTAFDVTLTGRLKPGRNTLMVHICHRNPNSRWYSGSGIYRDVYLVTLPEDHLVPDGLYLKEKEEDGFWSVYVSAQISGDGKQPFSCEVSGPDGAMAASAAGTCKGQTAEAILKIPDARPWSPEDPFLYQLTVRYGKQTEVRKIGLRSVSVSADGGMLLNGKPVRLKGVCLHHDLGALGAAFHKKAAQRQLELMREMGANAVRTSHNPPASAFLDLCDEMGILVIDEAFDMWKSPKTPYDYARFFDQWHKRDVASWVRRDRCHPCVIMWSVGNEIYDMHADPDGPETTKALADEVRRHDPLVHAFTTFGCNYMPWEGGQRCAENVDIVGYNYGENLYEKHHAAHPHWVLYGSETSSILSSRGIYHFPIRQSIMSEADGQCSSLGNSNTSWGAESLKKILSEDASHPFSLGQFLWSGIDYIGEPTPYHTRSCYFGQADTACLPKDSYYLVKSYWNPEKMIHIGVSWDWNRGQMIDIPVMTNCDEAELFLNGKSLGRKKNNPAGQDPYPMLWTAAFEPGVITAKGYSAGQVTICEDRRETPGEPVRIRLECENPYLLSDGSDLVFVRVSAEDAEHRAVENARNRVKITVSGGGRLIGTDNGDSTDTDSYKSDCRRLFSGKLLLIIASNGLQQDTCVHAGSDSCQGADLIIPCKKAKLLPGISASQKCFSKECAKDLSVRKIDLLAGGSTRLTPEHPECVFSYKILPEEAKCRIVWEAANAAGIETPYVQLKEEDGRMTVRANGDGQYYLRALCHEGETCTLISQTEFSAEGFGNPAIDPYSYVSAGLYDLHEGEIGTGNEKGISFDREGVSMIGFSQVDFGKGGSDTVTVDLFALNGDPYELEMFTAENGKETPAATLHYQKPSIWNVYQAETWKLPERLTGIRTLCFRMKDKVHMKGFVFERQEYAYLPHSAGSADQIYGDCFERHGDVVTGIGNNVTLTWTDMDFRGAEETELEIEGRTDLAVNTISVRIRNENGEEKTGVADFRGNGEKKQRFRIRTLQGKCSVSFVFLPGSSFDFNGFRFYRTETGQTGENKIK